MEEQWRPVPGFEVSHEVSSHGKIRSIDRVRYVQTRHGVEATRFDRGRDLKQSLHRSGYYQVGLTYDGRTSGKHVHVIVCEAFHGPRPEGHQVAHLDGDRVNNRSENLRWATVQENADDRRRHGTVAVGERCHFAKLSDDDALHIRDAQGETQASLAKRYGISINQVGRIRARTSWRHLPP